MQDVAFCPDGDSLAVGLSDGTTQVWSLPKQPTPGRIVVVPSAQARCLDVARDGTLAIGTAYSGDCLAPGPDQPSMACRRRQVDLRCEVQPRWTTAGHRSRYPSCERAALPRWESCGSGISRKRSWLASQFPRTDRCRRPSPSPRMGRGSRSREGRTVEFWSTVDGKKRPGESYQHDRTIDVFKLTADGRTLLIGDSRGRVSRYAMDSGKPLGTPWQLQQDGIVNMAVSPDGRSFVTVSRDGTVRRWDQATGEAAGPAIEHPHPVRGVVIHPDGRTLATLLLRNRRPVLGWSQRASAGSAVTLGTTLVHASRIKTSGDRGIPGLRFRRAERRPWHPGRSDTLGRGAIRLGDRQARRLEPAGARGVGTASSGSLARPPPRCERSRSRRGPGFDVSCGPGLDVRADWPDLRRLLAPRNGESERTSTRLRRGTGLNRSRADGAGHGRADSRGHQAHTPSTSGGG